MTLRAVTLNGFRGFSDPQTIDLSTRVTVLYGENGVGKSSFHEGIEWVLTGKISRAESEARGEYTGLYLKSLRPAPDGQTWVKLLVEHEGRVLEITRELLGAEKSALTIRSDGKTIGSSLTSIGLDDATLASSFLAQNKFKRLLEAEPSQRWSRFLDILGIKDIEEARSVVKQGITQAEKDPALSEARAAVDHHLHATRLALGQLSTEYAGRAVLVETLPDRQTIRTNSDFGLSLASYIGSAKQAVEIAKRDAFELLSVPPITEVSSLVEMVEGAWTERQGEKVALEAKYRAATMQNWDLPSNAKKLLSFDWNQVLGEVQGLRRRLENLAEDLTLVHANPKELASRVAFYEFGLQLLSGSTCPFCDQSVEPITLRTKVSDFLRDHKTENTDATKVVSKQVTEFEKMFRALMQSLRSVPTHSEVVLAVTLEAGRIAAELNRTFDTEIFEPHTSDLLNLTPVVSNWPELADQLLGKGLQGVLNLEMCLKDKTHIDETVAMITSVFSGLDSSLSVAKNDRNSYASVLVQSKLLPAGPEQAEALKLSTDAKVERLELDRLSRLRTSLTRESYVYQHLDRARNSFAIAKDNDGAVQSFDETIRSAQALVETLVQLETSLAARLTRNISDRVKQIYNFINPLDDFQFSELVIDMERKRIGFSSRLDGNPVNPVTHFSEAHLNCMGLAVFLATAESSKASFLLLDDPVQSMDKNHRGAVATLLRQEFVDKKQILIATHDETFYEILKVQFDGIAKLWEFSGWSSQGPWLAPAHREHLLEQSRQRAAAGESLMAGSLLRKELERYLDQFLKSKKVKILYGQDLTLHGKIDALRLVEPSIEGRHITNLQMARVFGNWGSHDGGPELSKGDVLTAIKLLEDFERTYPYKEPKAAATT